jgi:arylsulfatase A
LDKIEEMGLRENTIIVFMSDNGHSEEDDKKISIDNHTSGYPNGHYYGANGGGGNTGKWRGSKGSFFEGGIRVPAIISYPSKLPKGVVRDQAITACDWLPTIMELCNVPLPEVMLDGESIVSIINSANKPTHHKIMHWNWHDNWAAREGEWKLLGKEEKGHFLGNLNDSLPEKENYIEEKPEIAKHLEKLHNEWFEEVQPGGFEDL